jgi:DNA-binding transcriptional regulator YhcF (GntR family)
MRTVVPADSTAIAHALLGRVRTSVLRVLMTLPPGESLHLREIARRAQVAPAAAQREMTLLKSLGLANSESRGMQVFHQLDRKHESARAAIAALAQLVQSLPSLTEQLAAALRPMSPVYAATFARGGSSNEIGVIVVGAIAFEDALAVVEPVVQQFRPEAVVRLLVYSESGFKQRIDNSDATLSQALEAVEMTLIDARKSSKSNIEKLRF